MLQGAWQPPAVFRRLGLKQTLIGLGFGLLTIVVSFGAGLVLSQLIDMVPNRQVVALGSFGLTDQILFLLRTFIQLVGEELVTILPLLAVLWLCVQRFGMNRRIGLLVGVVISTGGSLRSTCQPMTGIISSVS